MSSKIRTSKGFSLAFRLTLWYGVIFSVSCTVAFFLFYLTLTGIFRQQADDQLLERATRFSRILTTAGLQGVQRQAVRESQAAGEKQVFFRLLSPDGMVFSSSNMSYWQDIAISPKAIHHLVGGGDRWFETLHLSGRRPDVRMLYRILGPGVIMQLGQSLETHDRLLTAFRTILMVSLGVLVVLAASVGWFMAKRALSGVATVTRTARSISGGSLDRRVPVEGGGDEIDQLAITVNQMLDRIQALVEGIRQTNDNIAHDLRSPLTRIRGAAEVALTTGGSAADFQAMAASTVEECDRLLEMINTMLLIAETEAGAIHPKESTFDLNDLVSDACELFEPTAEDQGVSVTCCVSGSQPLAFRGDRRMIQRLIANLLDNAIKYTPSEGRVVVRLEAGEPGWVTVSVADSGVGISDMDLPYIFNRFFRSDRSRSKPGVGLGLSLAKAVAEAHGGGIDVHSRLGQGSTFRIRLPLSSFHP